MGQQVSRAVFGLLAAITLIAAGCGSSEGTGDLSKEAAEGVTPGQKQESTVKSTRSNPVSSYKTGAAGEGDALK